MPRLLLLLILLHFYVGARLVPDLPFGLPGLVIGVAWLAASAALIPFAFGARRMMPQGPRAWRMWGGLIAMGAFSTLFVLTLLRDVGLFAVTLAHAGHAGNAQPDGFAQATAVAVFLATLLLTALGYGNARRIPPVRRIDVPIEALPPALHGFTIAQITDLHVGPTIRRGDVAAIVDAVNALDADLVAVTGDVVDGSVRQLAPHVEPLSRLESRHGSYFVTGNHEYYSGVHPWLDELRRIGLRVLLNEHVVIEHEGERIIIAGVTDPSAHHFDPAHRSDPHASLDGAPADAPLRVLLAHQPRSAFAAAQAGFNLQLSGHTHGGQFLPWNFFVRFQQPFTAGLRRLGALWVYTSRGTGYWGPPKRLGAPSEITRLRLVGAQPASSTSKRPTPCLATVPGRR
jgi:uncharacterized protein